MDAELAVRALVATTAMVALLGLGAVALRSRRAAISSTLWRGALLSLWAVPAAFLVNAILPVRIPPVYVPVMPSPHETVRAAAASIQPVASVSAVEQATANVTPSASAPMQPESDARVPLGRLLLLAWACGVGVGLPFALRDAWRIRRLLSRAHAEQDGTVGLAVGRWAQRMGLGRPPRIAWSGDVAVPIVVGWRSPCLLLPAQVGRQHPGLEAVIVHELAHIRRRDPIVFGIARITGCLWWWNPLTWLVARELRDSAEEACDAWAVELTQDRRAYAGLLVHWAEASVASPGSPIARRGKALIRRIRQVLSGRPRGWHTPLWVRGTLAVCVLGAAVGATAVHLRAQQEQAPPAKEFVLEDFSKPTVGRWSGGIEQIKDEDGQSIGNWYDASRGDHLVLNAVPPNWTAYDTLELLIWSETANGQDLMLLVYTGENALQTIQSFQKRLVVDWEGWRQIRLPFSLFRPVRDPAWTRVSALALTTRGWGVTALADTNLRLGKIRLLKGAPEAERLPPGVVSSFEEDDLLYWSGLHRDTEHVTEGASGGRWQGLDAGLSVHLKREMDWSAYEYLEFDCFSEAPTGDRFMMCILSMEEPPADTGSAYWGGMFRVDWEGWRHFKIPFRRLQPMRKVLGWDRVTGIDLFPTGWGMQPHPSPDTALVFDNMHLTKAEPRQPPPGMVEDFEDGPWAWWWMDEGSVKPAAGEHCGEFPLHEGWRRADCVRSLTPDWSGYQTCKLWLYTQALGGETLILRAFGSTGKWSTRIPLDGEGWREVSAPLTPNPGKMQGIEMEVEGLMGNDEGKANRELDPRAVLCLDDIRLE
jgi:beta-lactamase regulating signal transducer with metallopeptidase domain